MATRREALERILEQRPSKPLVAGDHMLLTHALRCVCAVCGRLIHEWEEDGYLLVAECCLKRYSLKTHSVLVRVEDFDPHESLLERAHGSMFPSDAPLRLEGEVEGA